ncbi:MAG: carbamoyl-phosphate synthase large subunit [Deltaproteobacteria bacterium]|nr:carbamoyl-phosphate synthase large subunit [Deltaproteobacteria bacterium]
MPKRNDIKSILLIGSGPIVIGQACEFDYSGTQALKALREEGYRTILVNSNPATIMTDPEYADATYIEPITADAIEKIIKRENPDALLPTMGGQTGLNVAKELHESGVLEKYNVELIGARIDSINKAEDREAFKAAMQKIGVPVAKSKIVHTFDEAVQVLQDIPLPVIIRPSFTLGGAGASFAYNQKEFEEMVRIGLEASPVTEVLIEESILHWKEFELEMMRDKNDNVVVICTIENFDPVGVHTGDSITVAPSQTLSDKEFQVLRDYAVAIMREIGVDSGGSNIQYAINPKDGRVIVIEMNPRVSRSSALASKATGYPIAKLAAKLAVGYTLDELPNDITKVTKASFEPTIDYVVTKIPRFDFKKFKKSKTTLGPQMRAVGEVMAMGRNFPESIQKAIYSLEENMDGFSSDMQKLDEKELLDKVQKPTHLRLLYLHAALIRGIDVDVLYRKTGIDPWFLHQLQRITNLEKKYQQIGLDSVTLEQLLELKKTGFTDKKLSHMFGVTTEVIKNKRDTLGIKPSYKMVDTCAAEFESYTNYLYSCYAGESESKPTDKKKVVILGSGPNRIGQGVEFDYCCVHASLSLRKLGFESILINCNPETVSTDYDISDRLYFEPLTEEHVEEILEREKPDGVIVQFGGQTPLKLSKFIESKGYPILGTSTESIYKAEDRDLFREILSNLDIDQPESAIAYSLDEVDEIVEKLPFPLMVRPSFVLGGRAMEVVENKDELSRYIEKAVRVSPEHPILIDRFLENSIEIDVDAISDGENTFVAGIMQHIEQAGVHSGDSSCVLPPVSIPEHIIEEIKEKTARIAKTLNVKGFLNIQYALQGDHLFIIEVNPRASRTVPFVSKSKQMPLMLEAVKVVLGEKLDVKRLENQRTPDYYSVKAPVFPFLKFDNEDTILGPEMKSTGEVMGISKQWEVAYGKAQIAAGNHLPLKGNVFLSVKNDDKERAADIAKKIQMAGFTVYCTHGTAEFLQSKGVHVERVNKVREGRPHIVDKMINNEIDLVMNTTKGKGSIKDSYSIRRTALEKSIPYFTTLEGASAATHAIQQLQERGLEVHKLQDL